MHSDVADRLDLGLELQHIRQFNNDQGTFTATARIAAALDISVDEKQPTGPQSHRTMGIQIAVNDGEILKHFL